ncbi:molybdopterin-synthase adenylyltransferase MoeB [Marinagarivorans algicola]|uniref:molybdopterin-synthase adenylyltransferase MoeB n=1 Tax=Marinagarivorans algicola TaxID=1513270 RepID=UPI00192E7218|nr:molybdopterin-synthase adenylyltransferase MoeB [Marinagarivorans algicola]
MTDLELARYSRQILLPQFDVAGQLALKNARVLIIGLGGLGSPAAMYMAAAGVGALVLVDDDVVDISNLQRQVVHCERRVGMTKVASAKEQLMALNSQVTIECIAQRIESDALQAQVTRADIVVDCSDNFATRCAINAACVKGQTPLVSGAAIRFEGQIAVFNQSQEAPCYQCLYGLLGEQNLSCSQAGVLSPIVGIVGAYQALEAIKVLAGVGEGINGRVQFFDGLKAQWREFILKKDKACTICAGLVD